jgi:asparagine synthase (glutamine-hydrolysing)
MRAGSLPRLSVEMGLVAVVATQLWHHLFIDGALSDLPTWTVPRSGSEGSTPGLTGL